MSIIENAQDESKYSSVAGKTAFPHFEYLYGMRQIIAGLIEEAVSETSSDDGADEQDIEQGLQQCSVDILSLVEFVEQPVAEREAGHEQQGIETEGIVADRENGGIDVPYYREKI